LFRFRFLQIRRLTLSMRIHIIIAWFLSGSFAFAQDSTLTFRASLLLAGATDQTPFWLHANQNGTVPMDGNFASGRWGIYKIYNPNNPRLFQVSSGAELITNYSTTGKLFFTDLFVAAKLGPVELMAGQQKNISGIVDTLLTSGSMSISGNARPFPRVQISIPEFYPLAFTNNFVSLKASYSDGLLRGSDILYGSIKHVDRTYFHQKSLYLRFGNRNLYIYGGVNHQAIWGGEDKIAPIDNLNMLDAYWHTITGKASNLKRIGNHFGTIDLAGEWNNEKWSVFLYRQNIYETGSVYKIINLTDGLNGIRIKKLKTVLKPKKFIFQSLLFEFVNTEDQGNATPVFGLSIFEKGNYFNHYIYRNGWSYLGRGIGTPLIPGAEITRGSASETSFTENNRSMVFHAGLTASWFNTNLLFKATYSRNMGTFIYPYNPSRHQASILINAERKVNLGKSTLVFGSVACDIGKLYPNATSLLLGIRKSGFLN